MKLRIINQRLKNGSIPLPSYATPGSAGLDLRACIDAHVTLRAHESAVLIPTGFAIHIDDWTKAGIILPRSGLAHKYGLTLGNSTGLIDSDYQGEIFVSCILRGKTAATSYVIQPGDRIAQLVIIPVFQPSIRIVDSFDETERGEDGFGSTGKN